MKDSGIEWIGEIPEGWKIAPLKRFAAIQTGNTPSKTSDANYYAANGIPWIKPDNLGYSDPILTTSEYLTQEGAYHARIMPPNTVFVCCIGSLGKVGFSSTSCACNQQINALVFNDLMFWKYGYYLTIAQESQYLFFGNGNVLQIINSTNQSNIACVLPSLENQRLIVYYLDSICSAIEVLISKTRSSIEEYKKLKQAVITQAVTKGVRSERKMKDSGVEWIGEIPKEWSVAKAKYCVTITHGSDPKNEGSIPVYGSGAESFKTCGEYKEGPTVLIGRKGATLHIPHYIEGKYWNVDTAFDVKAKSNFFLPYYYYLATSFDYKFYISQTTLPGMTQSNYYNMFLPFPTFPEQEEIVAHLDAKCAEIDGLIAKKEQLVKELESYKKSLIYEVVTGKREV